MVYEACGKNRKKTAQVLDVSYRVLYDIFKKHPEIQNKKLRNYNVNLETDNGGYESEYAFADDSHINVTPEERDHWHNKDRF